MSDSLISLSVVFNRRKTLDSKGLAVIEVYLNKDGQKSYLNTGIKITPEQWNNEKLKIIKHSDSTYLNNALDTFKKDVRNRETNIKNKLGSCSVADFMDDYKRKPVTIYFYDFAIDELNKEKLSDDRKIKLERFLLEFKTFSDNTTFSNMNARLIDDFENHLKHKNHSVNYIGKEIQAVKKYTLKAVKYGIIESVKNPFLDFKIKSEKTDRKFLSIDEIEQIEKIIFPKEKKNYELIRDLFLFQFYTGLRFGDVCLLKKEHFRETPKGLIIDDNKAQKTGKEMYIPLYALFTDGQKESKPERLIRKYLTNSKGSLFALPKGKDEKANNQYVNRILKERIITETNITKHITTHVARHSFASYMIWKMPVPVVGKLLQHSDIKTTMIYVHVSNENIEKELLKIDNWK